MILNQTLSSNASTSNVDFQGLASVKAAGTFDGATVAIQVSYAGEDFATVPDGTLTAASIFNLESARCTLRASMTDAGANSEVSIQIKSFRDVG